MIINKDLYLCSNSETMKKVFLILSAILCTHFGQGQDFSIDTISIEPYLSCQNYEHFRRLTLISSDSEAEYIDGFHFEWGFTYKLKVEVEKLSPELSDGTRYDFSLLEIISKTKAPDTTTFKFFIAPHMYYYEIEDEDDFTLKAMNDSTYLYFEELEIEVPEALRTQFSDLAKAEQGRLGTFTFVNEKRIRLVGLR